MAIRRLNINYTPQAPSMALLNAAMQSPLEGVLQSVEKFAQQAAVESGSQQAISDVMSGENPSLSMGLTPAGQAYNEAARKAYSVRTSMDIRAKNAELVAQYDGRNATDPQSYAERMGSFVSNIGASVPEAIRPQIMAEANLRYTEGLAAITETTNKRQYALHASELEAGYKASIDDASSLAMAGKHDLALAALAQGLGRIDDQISAGIVSPGEGEIKKRDARGVVAAGGLYQGFLAGRVSIESVQSGEVGAELPGHVRESLIRSMESEQAHRRSEQNYAFSQTEKLRVQGDRDLNAMTAKLNLGVPLTPDERGRYEAYASGRAPASPLQVEEANAAYKTLGVSSAVATARPEEIARVRGLWAANPPTSTEEALVRNKTIEAFNKREAALKDDAMAYAMSVLPDKFPSVTFPNNPNLPEFDAALRQLSDNADGIRTQFGVDAIALTKPDQQRLATMIANLPADQKELVRGKIQANMGPNAMKVWETLGKEGASIAAHAGVMASVNRADVARSIEEGDEAIKTGRVVAPKKDEVTAAWFESNLHVAFDHSQSYGQQIQKAGLARAAYLAKMAGEPENVAGYLEAGFRDVGGSSTTYNGYSIALPLGVDDLGTFTDRLDTVTPEVAATLGWPAGVAEGIANGDARLTSLGEGKYGVTIGTMTIPGFELDWNAIPEPASRPMMLNVGYGAIPVGAIGEAASQAAGAVVDTTGAVISNTVVPLSKAYQTKVKPYLPAMD